MRKVFHVFAGGQTAPLCPIIVSKVKGVKRGLRCEISVFSAQTVRYERTASAWLANPFLLRYDKPQWPTCTHDTPLTR